jgi:hypothetical protein
VTKYACTIYVIGMVRLAILVTPAPLVRRTYQRRPAQLDEDQRVRQRRHQSQASAGELQAGPEGVMRDGVRAATGWRHICAHCSVDLYTARYCVQTCPGSCASLAAVIIVHNRSTPDRALVGHADYIFSVDDGYD